ncbi:unnamed protein product [Closterium sp. Naga37s-1]|nr:unnamed protein product [Closterium sp. Naga37s-1]
MGTRLLPLVDLAQISLRVRFQNYAPGVTLPRLAILSFWKISPILLSQIDSFPLSLLSFLCWPGDVFYPSTIDLLVSRFAFEEIRCFPNIYSYSFCPVCFRRDPLFSKYLLVLFLPGVQKVAEKGPLCQAASACRGCS